MKKVNDFAIFKDIKKLMDFLLNYFYVFTYFSRWRLTPDFEWCFHHWSVIKTRVRRKFWVGKKSFLENHHQLQMYENMFVAQVCTHPSVRVSFFPRYKSSMWTNWNIPDTKHSERRKSCREWRKNYNKSLTIHHLNGATRSAWRKSMEKFEKRKLCGSLFSYSLFV